MRGKRENFFSREKKFSLSPRAPLTLSRKAENFFIYFYLSLSGTKPLEKGRSKFQGEDCGGGKGYFAGLYAIFAVDFYGVIS